jgi:hypothetical protein
LIVAIVIIVEIAIDALEINEIVTDALKMPFAEWKVFQNEKFADTFLQNENWRKMKVCRHFLQNESLPILFAE